MKKILLILSIIALAGCGAAVRVDDRADAISDKTIELLIVEHQKIHARMEQGIIWLEKENLEDQKRLDTLKQGLEHK